MTYVICLRCGRPRLLKARGYCDICYAFIRNKEIKEQKWRELNGDIS